MANLVTPFGFRPVRDVYGRPWNGAINPYYVLATDATAIMLGDLVTLDGSGTTIKGESLSTVTRSASTNVILGAVVAVHAETRDSTTYREALTARKVFVCDDPNALFMVAEVNSGTPLAVTDLGLNVNFVVAAGSTYTGMSGTTLNNATELTTNTLDCKIVGFVNREDNAIGVAAAKWLVRLNKHQYVDQIAGI